MPYLLSAAANPMSIDTQEYVIGSSGPVRFTQINSCVGIIVVDMRWQLNAIHLVEWGNGGDRFGQAQADYIRNLFPNDWVEVAFVGWHETWRDGAVSILQAPFPPAVQSPVPGFAGLYNYFWSKGRRHELSGDGNYSASVLIEPRTKVRTFTLTRH